MSLVPPTAAGLPAGTLRLLAAAAAALVAAAPATAGRAQAGSAVGLYSTWDLDSGATTGQGLRDGVVVQQVSVSGDPSSASIQVYDGLVSAAVRTDSQGVLRMPGDPQGLAFGGHTAVRADRSAGLLQLGASTSYAGDDGAVQRREAWASAYTWGEIVESFELLYPADRVDPVTVTLRMTVDGSVTGNDGSGNGRINGLQGYAILGNTDQGVGQFPGLSPAVWRTESSLSGQVFTITGTLLNPNCPANRSVCNSFFGLYAGLDLRPRVLSTGEIGYAPSGAPFSADFSVQLALEVSPGVTVLQFDNLGNHEPLHAWVNAAPVPEPGTGLLMLAGLCAVAALGGRGRRGAPRG